MGELLLAFTSPLDSFRASPGALDNELLGRLQGWGLGAGGWGLLSSFGHPLAPLPSPLGHAKVMPYEWFSRGRGILPPPSPLCMEGSSVCLSLLPDHTHPIATWSREGPGRGEGLLVSEARLSLSYPIGVLPLPPTSLRLQMESHPEEVPILLGPDLLTVRKAGVSRTHSLPNDSYMCRDGSTAEGSLGHRGWGLPKAQSGTKTGGGSARLPLGDPILA